MLDDSRDVTLWASSVGVSILNSMGGILMSVVLGAGEAAEPEAGEPVEPEAELHVDTQLHVNCCLKLSKVHVRLRLSKLHVDARLKLSEVRVDARLKLSKGNKGNVSGHNVSCSAPAVSDLRILLKSPDHITTTSAKSVPAEENTAKKRRSFWATSLLERNK